MPKEYWVIDNATGTGRLMDLVSAAANTHIAEAEIVSAIEMFGVCHSLDHTVLDAIKADDI